MEAGGAETPGHSQLSMEFENNQEYLKLSLKKGVSEWGKMVSKLTKENWVLPQEYGNIPGLSDPTQL